MIFYATLPLLRNGDQWDSVESQQSGRIPWSELKVKVMIEGKRGSTTDKGKGLFVKLPPDQKNSRAA